MLHHQFQSSSPLCCQRDSSFTLLVVTGTVYTSISGFQGHWFDVWLKNCQIWHHICWYVGELVRDQYCITWRHRKSYHISNHHVAQHMFAWKSCVMKVYNLALHNFLTPHRNKESVSLMLVKLNIVTIEYRWILFNLIWSLYCKVSKTLDQTLGTHMECTVNLMIANGHFNLPQRFLLVCIG